MRDLYLLIAIMIYFSFFQLYFSLFEIPSMRNEVCTDSACLTNIMESGIPPVSHDGSRLRHLHDPIL